MSHFYENDHLNIFRLLVSWQYLVKNRLGDVLDQINFGYYNPLVQGCLTLPAAYCIIDIHNYARWNGSIIGHGGPINDQLVELWARLATVYQNEARV
jgi:endoglucanase